jgi:hypothetical protein
MLVTEFSHFVEQMEKIHEEHYCRKVEIIQPQPR